MHSDTQDRLNELIDLLEANDYAVTTVEAAEFIRGDPTLPDAEPTGAEISLTVYTSFTEGDGDDNPYRVK